MHRSPVLKMAAAAALVLALLVAAPVRAATPASGTVSSSQPSTTWSGGPFLAINPIATTDCVVPSAPFCDVFALTIGDLSAEKPDVLVSIAATGASDVISVAIYDPAGTVVARSAGLSSKHTVPVRTPAPGDYSVRVELLLGVPGRSTYQGRAAVGLAGAPIDLEQDCVVEQTDLAVAPDDGRVVDLHVLVLLDGVEEAFARDFFTVVSRPYEELQVRVVPTFVVADPPFESVVSYELIKEARARFAEGKVPPEFDIVEVLTSKDIEALGQKAIAGQADCLGGLAYDERSYNVSEAGSPSGEDGVPIGPFTFVANVSAKITAHEIGHLLGGQHHYANCAEGIDPATEVEDTGPCTLMFNSADFLSLHFGTVNGRIMRGYAVTYAAANDGGDVVPGCVGRDHKKKGCKEAKAPKAASR